MKYPLQKELEMQSVNALKLYEDAIKCGNETAIKIALTYVNAINRINEICVNRNRF